ncbi:hypothetical protein VTK73DRAFT_6015 [Phialemonium thermophilum]|uniref:Uncharacterized protein n=1 Tax=Phialemonium thermophilum TaxID=223376 RepID=A0ABR3V049_9PEZI
MQGLPFTHHLGCMADLYGLRDDLSQLDPEMGPDLHHCLEVLGIMDLPTFVLGRSTPYLGFWARFRRIQHVLANGIVGGVEVVTGLPRSLLDIFSRIHEPGAEIEFWLWPGEIGQFPQIHLWNSWRYGGMLLARRASRKVNATAAVASQALHHPGQPGRAPFSGVPRTVVDGVKVTWNTRGQYGYVVKEFPLPSTEQLLCCVLSELDAMERELARPENSHSLVENGFLYPFLAACLQVSLLKAHPEWKVALCRFRDKWLLPGRTQNVDALLAVIDEAWASGDDDFDADAAAQRMNKEIALY